ncbi:MAG: flotillin, partial [Frankiales bacterium]|nr:flotillin [Frankiales bacterium]
PDLVRAAADGLKGANLTILDGTEGVNSAVASLASQGMAILNAVTQGLANNIGHQAAITQAPDRPAPGDQ